MVSPHTVRSCVAISAFSAIKNVRTCIIIIICVYVGCTSCEYGTKCVVCVFLVVIDHISHPYKSVDHAYAFIVIFLVLILMCRAVILFNIELNALLAI